MQTIGFWGLGIMGNAMAKNLLKAGFKVTGTGLVEYWVNDVYQGSVTTNVPVTELRVSFCVNNGTTAAEILAIDYIRAVQER